MILFTDLDGTLLNDENKLSAKNTEAIRQALKRGHQIVICTGRPLASGKILARELGLDTRGCYCIAFNGGEIYDMYRGESIYKRTIPMDFVRYLFDEAKRHGLHCQTYDDASILTESENVDLDFYAARTNIPYRLVKDVTAVLPGDPVKVIVINASDHERLVRFQEDTEEWCKGRVDRVFSCAEYLEHMAPGVSKGDAVLRLCRHLSIPVSQAIAAGDAPNDLSMIRAAGIGAAMANADAQVKAQADYVTKHDNNHDGVAEIIETFMR